MEEKQMECAIYLTDECNFSCSYCYESNRNQKNFMNESVAKKSIDYIFSVANKNEPVIITFLGGEPLLNKKALHYSVDYINKYYSSFKNNIIFKITTNASLLNEDDINFFKNNNFLFSISIDGNEETHNKNRLSKNGKNYYEKIMECINIMIYEDVDFIVRMTVTGNNVGLLHENIRHFFNMGVKKVNLGIDNFHVWSDWELKEFKSQLNDFTEYYINNIFGKEEKMFYLFDNKIGLFLEKRNAIYCNAGTESHFIINSSGNIYPCSFVSNIAMWEIGTVDKGINKNVFVDSLNKSLLLNNKDNPYIEKCSKCKIAYFCNAKKCGFGNFVCTGKLNLPSGSVCSIQKIIYELIYDIIKRLNENDNLKLEKYINTGKSLGITFSEDSRKIFGDRI